MQELRKYYSSYWVQLELKLVEEYYLIFRSFVTLLLKEISSITVVYFLSVSKFWGEIYNVDSVYLVIYSIILAQLNLHVEDEVNCDLSTCNIFHWG